MNFQHHLLKSLRVLALLAAALTCAQSSFANTAQQSLNADYASRADQISDLELKRFLQNSLSRETLELDRYDAEVWLESMLSRMDIYELDKVEALEILHAVYREATASELEPDLVLAVIAIESGFKRFAISSAGAQGLMQVMPFWKNEIGRPDDNLMDIGTNIRYGCRILQYYMQRSGGHYSDALARYNGSYGKTRYPEKVLVAWKERWHSGRIHTAAK